MGQMAKEMGLKKTTEMNLDENPDICYMSPDPGSKDYFAKSKDYILVMHFSDSFKDRVRGISITEDMILKAFQDFQLQKMKDKDQDRVINFPSFINNVKAHQTFC